MKKILTLTLIYSLISIKTYSQNLTFENLVSYLTKQNNLIAEELQNKGYEFEWNPMGGEFVKGDEIDAIKIKKGNLGYDYVEFDYSKKYENKYSYIIENMKKNAKKTITFYSPWFKIYVTEYIYKKNIFVYVGQGIQFTTKDNKSAKFIIVASDNLRNDLFKNND